MSVHLSDLRSDTVVERVRGGTLVWPIGSVEQHGPHLPLSVDSDIAGSLAAEAAAAMGWLVLPTQSISTRSLPQSGGGLAFPGTIFVDGASFLAYITSAIRSVIALPIGRLIVINGHYENESFIFEAVDALRERFDERGIECLAFSWWSLVDPRWIANNIPSFPGWHAEHAGLTETSVMLHLRPEVVGDARPGQVDPPPAGIYRIPDAKFNRSDRGVLSSTVGSSAELGRSLHRHVLHRLSNLVNGKLEGMDDGF